VVPESEYLGNEGVFGSKDLRSRTERDRWDLHQPLIVSVSHDPRVAQEVLVDRRLGSLVESSGAVEVKIACAFEVVQLTQNATVQIVLDGKVVPPLHGLREVELEVAEADIAENTADLLHAEKSGSPPY